ncbi:hypothetical protein C8J56DRAFT_949255 [Mycena floridula]|nr:hypothetical protein C8J56DRAFT_949255 [Mycena floridula]
MRRSFTARTKIAIKDVYTRVTLNRLTAAFFVFGFIHCFAQGIMHSFLFTVDSDYSTLLTGIVHAAQIPSKNHTFLDGTAGNYKLVMCNWIPHTPDNCSTIFQSKVDMDPSSNEDPISRGNVITQNIGPGDISIYANLSAAVVTSVTLRDHQGDVVTLSGPCTSMLTYAQQLLQNYKREDLVWMLLQFWMFAISLTSMLCDSVPHILAALGARVLATAWSIYALYRTHQRKQTFHELFELAGTPCSVEIFPIYYQTRMSYEIPDIILNFSALLVASYLSWTLLKVYNTQSFKRLGAPEHITRVYRFFMAVQACLQLESFVLLTAMGLWIDQLFNTYVRNISEHTGAYEIACILTTAAMVPWIATGWYAIRREMKRLMVVFLAINFGFVAGWAIMFYSQVYRWSFIAWPALGCYMVASFILLITTIGLGIVCRMNFGQGLAQYLHAEDALAKANFSPSVFDIEKSNEKENEMVIDYDLKSPGSQVTYYLPSLGRTLGPHASITSGSPDDTK